MIEYLFILIIVRENHHQEYYFDFHLMFAIFFLQFHAIIFLNYFLQKSSHFIIPIFMD